MYKKNQRDSKL